MQSVIHTLISEKNIKTYFFIVTPQNDCVRTFYFKNSPVPLLAYFSPSRK